MTRPLATQLRDARASLTYRWLERIEELAFRHGEMALGVLASGGPGRHEIELAPRRDRSFRLTGDRRIVVFHNY